MLHPSHCSHRGLFIGFFKSCISYGTVRYTWNQCLPRQYLNTHACHRIVQAEFIIILHTEVCIADLALGHIPEDGSQSPTSHIPVVITARSAPSVTDIYVADTMLGPQTKRVTPTHHRTWPVLMYTAKSAPFRMRFALQI